MDNYNKIEERRLTYNKEAEFTGGKTYDTHEEFVEAAKSGEIPSSYIGISKEVVDRTAKAYFKSGTTIGSKGYVRIVELLPSGRYKVLMEDDNYKERSESYLNKVIAGPPKQKRVSMIDKYIERDVDLGNIQRIRHYDRETLQVTCVHKNGKEVKRWDKHIRFLLKKYGYEKS